MFRSSNCVASAFLSIIVTILSQNSGQNLSPRHDAMFAVQYFVVALFENNKTGKPLFLTQMTVETLQD